MNSQIQITAFYRFVDVPTEKIADIKNAIQEFGELNDIRGLVLIASEGFNGTVAATPEGISLFKAYLRENWLPQDQIFKDSWAATNPFRRFKADIRKEIVSLFDDSIDVQRQIDPNSYLNPEEWDRILQTEAENVVLLDTRNTYETRVGKFVGAVDPCISVFSDFPKFVAESNIPKDKKILMYCTGGIRCEKASLSMKRAGYDKVYQLEGGILRYLQERPRHLFEGECFVFDHRVAVDQDLQPSTRYSLCPHCGDPAEQLISCCYCSGTRKICDRCMNSLPELSCSKNCRHHLDLKAGGCAQQTVESPEA